MKIIVDTNIVFSGILNSAGKIGKILIHSKSHFQFYTCEYLRTEIFRHTSRLSKLTKLSANALTKLETLVTSNITFMNETLLPIELIVKTENLLRTIDPNDTHLLP